MRTYTHRIKFCHGFLPRVHGVACGAVIFLAGIQFAVAGGFVQSYSVFDLGGGQPHDINNNGQVVGSFGLYSGGVITSFGGPAYGINNNGQVVGYANTAHEAQHAFLYSGGTMTDLGTLPGGSDSHAYGINNNGQVVGSAGADHAFLYSGGTMTDLGTLPGGSGSQARRINNSGQIVGSAYTAGDNLLHAVLYGGGGMTDLGTLGGKYSTADYINDHGQVVGEAYTADNAGWHAFLYDGGTMVDLNTLIPTNSSWFLRRATAINDNGWIVGYGTNPSGQTDAFLLAPLPEPTTFSLFAFGCLVFVLCRRR